MDKKIESALKETVIKAGEIMLSAENIERHTEEKGSLANLVTEYDLRVQKYLIENIRNLIPEAVFFAEENEGSASCLSEKYCFIIDPIDGTSNFVYGYRHSCISVAVIEHGECVLGIIYDPYQKEMFYAKKGEGAYLNGVRLSVASHDLAHSLITFGTSPYRKEELGESTFNAVKKLFFKGIDVRRTGSAALDLAYVAAGRTDAFFEMVLSPWDYAAGMLIVSEAGGICSDLSGNSLSLEAPSFTVAASSTVYSDFIGFLRDSLL